MLRNFFVVAAIFLVCYSAPVKAQECDICQTVIGAVENWIESNYTETEITQLLETLCAYIPGIENVVSNPFPDNIIIMKI
jgi:hypothetical protein